MYRFLIFILALSLPAVFASAQPDRSDVRKGNRDFRKEDWKEAEIDYRKALVKDSTSLAANYNLANTLYKMGDYSQASKGYSALKDIATASDIASDWYYNTGNASAQTKDWQAAVDAYRQSLLLNPGDMDAKENYIYAKKMLQNQQNQQQNQDQNQQNNNQNQQNNNQNQDQNKDQNQDQDQDNKQDQNNQNNNQDQNNQNQQDQDQQGQNGQQPKITPQAAQQMLQAIQAKEKETQEKVKKEKAEALKSRQKEKNW